MSEQKTRKDRSRNEALILLSISRGINTWTKITDEVHMTKRPVHEILRSLEERKLIVGKRSNYPGIPNTKEVIYEIPFNDCLNFAKTSNKVFSLLDQKEKDYTRQVKTYMKTEIYNMGIHNLSLTLEKMLSVIPSKVDIQGIFEGQLPQDDVNDFNDLLQKILQRAGSDPKMVSIIERLKQENILKTALKAPSFRDAMSVASQNKGVSMDMLKASEIELSDQDLNSVLDAISSVDTEATQELLKNIEPKFTPFADIMKLNGIVESAASKDYSHFLDKILLSFPDSAKFIWDLISRYSSLDALGALKKPINIPMGSNKSVFNVPDVARAILAYAALNIDTTNVIIPEKYIQEYLEAQPTRKED